MHITGDSTGESSSSLVASVYIDLRFYIQKINTTKTHLDYNLIVYMRIVKYLLLLLILLLLLNYPSIRLYLAARHFLL